MVKKILKVVFIYLYSFSVGRYKAIYRELYGSGQILYFPAQIPRPANERLANVLSRLCSHRIMWVLVGESILLIMNGLKNVAYVQLCVLLSKVCIGKVCR